MIFGIWFAIWMLTAAHPVEMALPFLMIGVRSAYMDRVFPRVKAQFILVWVIIAGLTALLPEQGVTGAILLFMKIASSATLILHYIHRLQSSRLKRVWGLRDIWFFSSRALLIIRERVRDIGYSLKVRLAAALGARSKVLWLFSPKFWQLSSRAVISFLVELVLLSRRIENVVDARGVFPSSLEWVYKLEPRYGWALVSFADLTIAFAMLGPAVVGAELLVPDAILGFLPK